MGAEALRVARDAARVGDPSAMARLGKAVFDSSVRRPTLTLELLGARIGFSWPELELSTETPGFPEHVQSLALYYLARTDGTPPSGRIMCFADLPDGRFYAQAFRGYTGARLASAFAEDPEGLDAAARSLGGCPATGLGDRAWRFTALPLVPLTLVWWDGDDEFDARAEVMFDSTAPHHLTTDGCAVLGSWLTASLVGASAHGQSERGE